MIFLLEYYWEEMQKFHHQEMANQEWQEDINEFGAINGIATLNLRSNLTDTSISDHHRPPPPLSHHHCSACGCFIKKRSHSSSLLSPSPKKKLLFSPSSSSAAAAAANDVCEFVKSPPAGNSLPSLHRWNSDSIISSEITAPRSPKNSKAGEILTSSSPARAFSSLPPLPRPLLRSVSDPPPLGLLDSSLPFQFPISGEIGPSSIVRVENPNYKKMKKMKEQLKEMIQYWEDIDDDDDEEENGGSIEMKNCDKEDEKVIQRYEEEDETETISVERHGNSLIIQLNCSCGKASQILLSGKNCYHKLL